MALIIPRFVLIPLCVIMLINYIQLYQNAAFANYYSHRTLLMWPTRPWPKCMSTVSCSIMLGLTKVFGSKCFWLPKLICNNPATDLAVLNTLNTKGSWVTTAVIPKITCTSGSPTCPPWTGNESPVQRTLLSIVSHVKVDNSCPSCTTTITSTIASVKGWHHSVLKQSTNVLTDFSSHCFLLVSRTALLIFRSL